MNKLTKVEKWFVSAMEADPKAPHGLYDSNNIRHWPYLRKTMRKAAYHEADHLVARMFTTLELYHVVSISIIPEDGTIGRMEFKGSEILSKLAEEPPPIQRIQGMMKLLEEFAGYGTGAILNQSKKWGCILEYCVWKEFTNEFINDDDDIFRAMRIAEIMAKPNMPVHKIFKLADKWTLEMLRIAAVWNAVETIAGKLIEKGEITNVDGKLDAMIDEYSSVVPKIHDLKKWEPLFSIKPREREKCFGHL